MLTAVRECSFFATNVNIPTIPLQETSDPLEGLLRLGSTRVQILQFEAQLNGLSKHVIVTKQLLQISFQQFF